VGVRSSLAVRKMHMLQTNGIVRSYIESLLTASVDAHYKKL
jgi:hypothetical protein